jgi:hypothetical protein
MMRSRSVPKVIESTSLSSFATALNGLWALPILRLLDLIEKRLQLALEFHQENHE